MATSVFTYSSLTAPPAGWAYGCTYAGTSDGLSFTSSQSSSFSGLGYTTSTGFSSTLGGEG